MGLDGHLSGVCALSGSSSWGAFRKDLSKTNQAMILELAGNRGSSGASFCCWGKT